MQWPPSLTWISRQVNVTRQWRYRIRASNLHPDTADTYIRRIVDVEVLVECNRAFRLLSHCSLVLWRCWVDEVEMLSQTVYAKINPEQLASLTNIESSSSSSYCSQVEVGHSWRAFGLIKSADTNSSSDDQFFIWSCSVLEIVPHYSRIDHL